MRKHLFGILALAAWWVVPACSESDSSSPPNAEGSSGATLDGGAGTMGEAGGAAPDAKHEGSVEASAGASGQGGAAGSGAFAGAGGSGASAGSSGNDAGPCVDTCPSPAGVLWGCEKRFMYGVNYAWLHFAGDFGGISAWGQGGVAAESSTHLTNLKDMHDHGASAIRWWMFPDFRADSVKFDANDSPTGLGATTIADVQKALELADQADVFLMFTVFSFDNFRPSATVAGLWTPGIKPMVQDAAKRTALLENVVRPIAKAVQASPYAHRMIAWDVINEPEWAMTGPSPYGDQDYTPTSGLEALSHAEMESFVQDTVAVLRAESGALISVGGAAFKWAHAWKNVDTDFHHFHMYSWINDWWPYTGKPADYDLGDKPLVMGELPMGDLAAGISYLDVLHSWWSNGYAGALSWQYNESTPAGLADVAAFASEHPCETRYTAASAKSWSPQSNVSAAPGGKTVGRICVRGSDGRPNCGG